MNVLKCDLRSHVASLADELGERNVLRPDALRAAADYISTVWRGMGYAVVEQCYEVRGVSCTNLAVIRKGRKRPEQILVIGAHYDTVPGSPGADDNASGIAALLEISRRFLTIETDLTVRFVAFVNEEAPFFSSGEMGSMFYARAARRRGDDIRLMMSLEMLGYYDDAPGSQRYPPLFRYFYPHRGNFIGFVSNLRSRRMLHKTVRAFRAHSDFPAESVATFAFIPGVALSDHLSFWRAGYRALMVTDTAFYRNPYYHTPLDTPDRIDYVSMARVTAGLSRAIAVLANMR
ncbi:MAG: M28 family metallopeptidase, partial [Gammaproteobacteria bacterium]|nr:M28 family metallopeptidase [Gammaproteobacteria bacterium]